MKCNQCGKQATTPCGRSDCKVTLEGKTKAMKDFKENFTVFYNWAVKRGWCAEEDRDTVYYFSSRNQSAADTYQVLRRSI